MDFIKKNPSIDFRRSKLPIGRIIFLLIITNLLFIFYLLIFSRVPALKSPLPKKIENKSATTSAKPSLIKSAYADYIQPTDQEIADYIKSKDWDYDIAIRVAKSEDFWNLTHHFIVDRIHHNTNGTTDYGVFQINSVHGVGEEMFSYKKNIDKAYEIYKDWGNSWQPWSAFKNGSYLTHDTSI